MGAQVAHRLENLVVGLAEPDHQPGLGRHPGHPAAELGKVLQPFYRVEGSRNRLQGGVGLGLAIAHDIARQHQGQLSLCNAPTGGLVASLSLPR